MIRRKIKNAMKHFTEAEILVREATSNDPWGASNTLLSKIAEMTNDEMKITQIMPIIWKRLKDNGKNWRHVYKSLLLMEFLILRGSQAIADHCRQHIPFLKTLEQFQYVEKSEDIGERIRRRVQAVVKLLKDSDLLKEERRKAILTDMKFSSEIVSQGSSVPVKYGNGVGTLSQGPSVGSFVNGSDKDGKNTDYIMPANSVEEDIQLEIALAESRFEAEQKRKLDEVQTLQDEYKLTIAIEKNRKENNLVEDNSNGLFTNVISNTDPWGCPANNGSCEWTTEEKVVDSVEMWPITVADKCVDWPSDDPLSNHSIDNDPWSTPSFPHSVPTIINNASLTTVDPWGQVPATQPVSRKEIFIDKKENVATKFLGSHSHLVDFENLISSSTVLPPVPKRSGYNPFGGAETVEIVAPSGVAKSNPFLPVSSPPLSVVESPVQTIDWNSDGDFNTQSDFFDFQFSREQVFSSPDMSPTVVSTKHYNPFLQ